jgi:hypothetical protein
MPIILPRDTAHLHTLIGNHASQFEAGEYKLSVPAVWLPTLDDATLIFLARTDAEPQTELARLRRTPVLEVLANSPHSAILDIVAQNDAASEAVLSALAKSPHDYVRQSVAKNLSASRQLLELLSRDDDVTVRTRVAEHANTPGETLEWLSCDSDWHVVAGVAGRGGETGVQLLLELAQRARQDERIAFWLINHPALPASVTLSLGRMVAAGKLDILPALMRSPNLTREALGEIACSTNPEVVRRRLQFHQFREPEASSQPPRHGLLQRIVRWIRQ